MMENRLPKPALRYHRWWVLIGIGLVLLLLYGSLAPANALPQLSGSDKVWHAGTYFIVMAYFSQIYAGVRARALIGAAFIALGIAVEFIQPYVNRHFDWLDALANSLGVFAGLAVSLSPLNEIITRIDGLLKRGKR